MTLLSVLVLLYHGRTNLSDGREEKNVVETRGREVLISAAAQFCLFTSLHPPHLATMLYSPAQCLLAAFCLLTLSSGQLLTAIDPG